MALAALRSALHGGVSTLFSNLFITLPYPEGDLKNQVIIVTGSNTGLGFEASRHLLRLGVTKLIMGVRNLEKGERAKRELLTSTKREEMRIEVWQVDMDSYNSVKAFASRAASLPRLDAVLANAGILTETFAITEDNEKTITTNVVSTFLLFLLTLPKLRQSAEQFGIVPRFVIPNSALHYMAPLKELDVKEGHIFATLNDPKIANMGQMARYPVSKLLDLYIVRELADRMRSSKKPVVVINTPNPSYCQSGLLGPNAGKGFGERHIARSTELGSRALVHGILSGVESQGQYLTNCHVQTYATSPSSLRWLLINSVLVRLFW